MTTIQHDQLTAGKLPTDAGTLLAPLFTWRGRDVYPVFGAEGEEGGDGNPDSEPDDDDDSVTGEGESTGSSDAVSREEFDQLRKQLSAADKRRDDAEKRLREIDDAKKDELTKATERAEELQKQNEGLAKDLAELRLQNTFLTAETGITWHDPADALALAERQGYLDGVVGEDGKVDKAKLTAKLKELAKAKPHLVRDGNASNNNGNKKDDDPKPLRSGGPVGSKGSGGKKQEDALPSRYDKYLNR